MDRRSFVNRENFALCRFLEVEELVGWRRSYKCECGFRCTSPGEIFDHTSAHVVTADALPQQPGQLSLFATEAR